MKLQSSEGFTLLEILVVVMIIGLLTTILATNLIGRSVDAQIQLTGTQIRQIEQALEMYRLDSGRYPTADQGLSALVREPSSDPRPRRYPPGGYVKPDMLTDPWDNPYQYRVPGEHNPHGFDLFSFGPDGTEGGEGQDSDITNWSSEPL
jgi:general secretion pathway protein G